MKFPMNGSCQCGDIRYTVNADPLFIYACHCHTCQQRTGSVFSMALVILTESLELQGELTSWSRVSDLGNSNTRYSCASCGNIIYGVGDSSTELTKLQAGTLADTSDIEPEVHMWVTHKQPWLTLPTRVRQFETQPEDPLELLQAALDYRAESEQDTTSNG
jgi:hypothetical protein